MYIYGGVKSFSSSLYVHDYDGLRESEWLLFNANSAIVQLYRGEYKLIFNEMMMGSAMCYTNTLSLYIASSLKQQSADKHVAPLWNIILISSQPVFALSP